MIKKEKMMEHYTSFEEFKKIELNILRYIKQVCEKENILFYLGYGTALGAVRHKGYIPWDDDIDVVFFRKDYLRFAEAMKKQTDSVYKLLSLETDPKFDYPFPKMVDTRTSNVRECYRSKVDIGVYIDIFIMDKVPEEPVRRKALYQKLQRLTLLWQLSVNKSFENHSAVKRMILSLTHLLSLRSLAKRMNAVSQKYNGSDSSLYRVLMLFMKDEPVFEQEKYGKGVLMEFEDDWYPIPEKYDEYLTAIYGNYMQFPREEMRHPKHENKALILDEAVLK